MNFGTIRNNFFKDLILFGCSSSAIANTESQDPLQLPRKNNSRIHQRANSRSKTQTSSERAFRRENLDLLEGLIHSWPVRWRVSM
jgi:hypothetical protein